MTESTPLSTSKPVLMFRIGVLIVLAAAASAGLLFLPVHEYLSWFLAWVHDIGLWGAVLLGAAYIPAALLFIPGSLLTLGAGFAFGVGLGTVAVSIGSTVGASAAFLAGRTLARGFIKTKVSRNARFRAIDQAVRQQGFKIALLTRLSPTFPFNLLNYAFGWSVHLSGMQHSCGEKSGDGKADNGGAERSEPLAISAHRTNHPHG